MYRRIQHAREVLKGIAKRTPVDRSGAFSEITGGEVFLKLENMQRTGSFKVRGATYAISQLTQKQKSAGVIAASAGNHAQGVALAASKLGIACTIVMPVISPIAKIQATKSYGANVILHGVSFDDALAEATEIAKKTGATFIHPFNDLNVIAGQGTIGLEILDEVPNVQVVAVPVGGGGLSTGIAIAIKHERPDVCVFGVEAASAPSMLASLREGRPLMVGDIDTICDGIAVKKPGPLTLEIAKDRLDGVVTVEELEVSRTLFLLLERSKIVVEPAGCVGLTAMQFGKVDVRGKVAVAVLSGGNIDMSMMSKIVDKELVRLGRCVRLRGSILDRVGSLNKVLTVVAESGVSVIDIRHDRSDPFIPPNRAELLMSVEVPDRSALQRLLNTLDEHGMHFEVYED
ncbi:MAG: threonine ammonia-lyase [Candidatus Thorarchaeota archaeon]|nr:threonine ammonia-lyase [Candidatus Thorarchaeota archaeon]